MVKKYLKVRIGGSESLFVDHNGVPYSRQHIAKFLQICLGSLGKNPAEFNTHSFRIGRTTDLVEGGALESTIQQAGRWKSNAYKSYSRIDHFLMPE